MIDDYTHIENNVFYITESILGPSEQSAEYEQLFNSFNSQLIEHCSCCGVCSEATCECLQKSYGGNYIAYKQDGKLKYKLLPKSKYPILECNDCCLCSTDCGNRVVQKGPVKGLVIRSCDKGYGLYATTLIPSGTFVCEYAGELITTTQSLLRHHRNKAQGKMNYIFCLRELASGRQPIITIVDPGVFGNIGRYINHSCEPNCHVMPVRCASPVPKLAIFAHTDIAPNEELTFHYGINDETRVEAVSDKIRCLCKTKSCTGFMPFHIY